MQEVVKSIFKKFRSQSLHHILRNCTLSERGFGKQTNITSLKKRHLQQNNTGSLVPIFSIITLSSGAQPILFLEP